MDIQVVVGFVAVIFLLIAIGWARNEGWGPLVCLWLAGMCAMVVGAYSRFILVELSLPVAGILFFISCVGLAILLKWVAAKDHEWLAIMGGLVCCLMLTQCANRLFPVLF